MKTAFPYTQSLCQRGLLLAVALICCAHNSAAQLKWSVNFGRVKVGESKTESVEFINSGSASITISKYVTKAPGFAVHGLRLPVSLAAGHSIAFNLVFTPLDGRTIMGSVFFYSNAPNSPLTLHVDGKGLTCGTLSATPTGIDFGIVELGTTLTRSEKLTNSGNCNVTLLKFKVSGNFTTSGPTVPLTLAPGQSATFSVKFAPKSTGAESGSLNAVSSATDSDLVSTLYGAGSAAGKVSISPTSLSFGNVSVGSSKSETASLTASGASLTLTSAGLSSSEFSLGGLSLPLTLAPGQTKSFTVKFTPKSSGSAAATLSFVSDGTNTPTKESLTGTGLVPVAHAVTLSWNESTSAVIGYNIYRGSKSGGPYSKINAVPDASKAYVDSSVSAGQTYYYVVTAVSANGVESSRSPQVEAAVP